MGFVRIAGFVTETLFSVQRVKFTINEHLAMCILETRFTSIHI